MNVTVMILFIEKDFSRSQYFVSEVRATIFFLMEY